MSKDFAFLVMTLHNPRKLTYKYKGSCPQIPVAFFDIDGKLTQTYNNAILDTGAMGIAIPEWLANLLKLPLTKRKEKGESAGGNVDVYITKGNFNIGRGGVFVEYTDVEINVLKDLDNVLIGMNPVFDDFIVTIDGKSKKFTLDPRK